jgi:acid-sensing ion channel, other
MLETGYHSNKSPKVYPRRAAGSGEIAGLQFDIHRQLTEFKDNDSFEKGFKIVFHLPNEVPRLIKQFYRIPLEKKVTIIVDPSMIVTENLESYSIETRQCYFEKERKLKYFRSYTRSNCQIECSANYTRKKCNCIHHSMPRLDNETTCDNEQQSCYHEGKLDTLNHIMEKSLNTSRNRYDRGKMACECLPACTSLEYNAVTSQDEIRYFGKIRDSR